MPIQVTTRRARLARPAWRPESLEPRRLLASVVWDGGGDGARWEDPLNWDRNRLPVTGDQVTINLPGASVLFDAPAADLAIDLLTIGAASTLTLRSGTLAPRSATASSVAGTLRLDGTAAFAPARAAVASGGRIEFVSGRLGLPDRPAGQINILAGAVLDLPRPASSPDLRAVATRLTNDGTINFGGYAIQLGGMGAALVNRGTFNADVPGNFSHGIQTDHTISSAGASGVFRNEGTFIKTGTGSFYFFDDGRLTRFVNTGTLRCDEGDLYISGAPAPQTASIVSGTLAGAGEIHVYNNVKWTGGSIEGPGPFFVDGGASTDFFITNGDHRLDAQTFLRGRAAWADGGLRVRDVRVSATGSFWAEPAAGVTLNLMSLQGDTMPAPPATWLNGGDFVKRGAGAVTVFPLTAGGGTFDNAAGRLFVEAGQLTVPSSPAGSVEIRSGGTLLLADDGRMESLAAQVSCTATTPDTQPWATCARSNRAGGCG